LQVKILFVTATGTGVGKTFATLRLLDAFARRGLRVGVCKPVETGVVGEPEDAALLLKKAQKLNPSFDGLSPRDLCAYTFPLPAAPFCADTLEEIRIERILRKIEELQRRCELLLVEGAGGLMVPLTRDFLMIDLVRELEAFTLLVAPSRLGCINETLLSLEALRNRGLPHDWCVNLHEEAEAFPRVTRPYYDAAFPGWWSLQEGLEKFVDARLVSFRIQPFFSAPTALSS
jgi:dethiobiotin synthetase